MHKHILKYVTHLHHRAMVVLLCLMVFGILAQAQQQNTLDNGLIRLTFDQNTGFFQVSSLQGGVLRLFDAGPAFEIEGKKVVPHNATKTEASRQNFEDPLGQGERLSVSYSFGSGLPSVRYELAVYTGKPWLSAVAYLTPGDYRLGDFSVVQGKVHVLNAFRTRVYVNSGTAGGDSGVWPLGLRRWESADLSALYDPRTHDTMGIGFYSFDRASASVMAQYLGSDEVGVDAVAHYYSYRPQNGELRTERLLIDFSPKPLHVLDDWSEAVVNTVHPKFIHDTHRGLLNTWYIYGDRTTENDLIYQMKLLRRSILPSYGITSIGLGEWQYQRPQTGTVGDNYGFGETETDPHLFPHGVQWLANQFLAAGFQPVFGANYAYAALHSSIAQKHEPWIDWNDFGRLSFGYPIDFTDPRAQQWLYNLAHHTVDYKAVEWWDDFDGGPTRGTLHDPTKIMQFEDIREGIKTIRRAIGPDVVIHRFCCGPYFTYVGLADRVRIGIDAPALGAPEFKDMARQFAADYMLHQRIWVNEPDPLFVGGEYNRDMESGPLGADPALSREVRMRLQEQIISGGPVTIGENIADFTPERFHLLTLVLPVYGQAARPLDLFVHTTPEIYDLSVKTNWDSWHVLLIQNWNDTNKTYDIQFSNLGLDEHQNYLVFRFWDQKLLGEFRGRASLNVGPEEGQTYAIRPVPEHPWVLSTDMHLTQGGMELHDVRYDDASQQLSGTASRHAGDKAHVLIYVPKGYSVRSASGPYQAEKQTSGAEVVSLELAFNQPTAQWSIAFQKPQ